MECGGSYASGLINLSTEENIRQLWVDCEQKSNALYQRWLRVTPRVSQIDDEGNEPILKDGLFVFQQNELL